MFTKMLKYFLILSFIPVWLFSQNKQLWKAHDLNRPLPKIIAPPAQYLPVAPPSDAIVLYDGSDLSKWEGPGGEPAKWINHDGFFECVKGSGYIWTKQSFGDIQLHVEWAAPLPVEGEGQGRGNSGVFLMGLYEVQVLDSYDNVTYADGQAAAVYGQYPPQVNASRPPGEWQSYDIVFHRPHFNSLGVIEKRARVTVFHNGVLVQDNVELWGATEWQKYAPYKPHPDKLPISLQDHGNPVRYRNIWVRELSEEPEKEPQYMPAVKLEPDVLKKYAGLYENDEGFDINIAYSDDKLIFMRPPNRNDELIPHSKTKFSLRYTAVDIEFTLDQWGEPIELSYKFTGENTKFKKIE